MYTATPEPAIEVMIQHPYRLIVDALCTNLGSQGKFVVNHLNESRIDSSDIALVDPQTASTLLEDIQTSRCRVVVLSLAARESEVQRLIQAGAFGFVVLSSAMSEVQECLLTVARGNRYICREAALSIVAGMTRTELTLREKAVLELLVHGLCNKSIARELAVADGTVKTHVKSILSKLGADTRTQAARFAVERGLVAQ